jgi:phosphosulfolactate synthase
MMNKESKPVRAWNGVIEMPLKERNSIPKGTGITMVLDKGVGKSALQDLLEIGSSYISFWKFSFGTSAVYPQKSLEEKIEILLNYGIYTYPGGTLFEVAWMQDQYESYLKRLTKLGFNAVEISDGTYPLTMTERRVAIKKAKDAGLKVLSEIGKKDPKETLKANHLYELLQDDLESGADYVIVEGRESGKGVGIYDSDGAIKEDDLNILIQNQNVLGKLIWEAPIKAQQVAFIRYFGSNVNLGNIPVDDIIALEALRTGLRGDTLKDVVREYLP